MQLTSQGLALSATDLANHLACQHLTELNLAKAHRLLEPPYWHDPMVEVLRKRGQEHERAYLEFLAGEGLSLASAGRGDEYPDLPCFKTPLEAMHAGVDVIAQAHLGSGRWHGFADVLRRVEYPSELGRYSYEVVDTKLARETRGGTILQLCLYSELLAELQGERPERMYVVSPGKGFEPESFRVNDFLSYYRLIKQSLDQAVSEADPGSPTRYPEPCEQCQICNWWKRCNDIRRGHDHLTFVAGVSKSQIRELLDHRVDTLADLAVLPTPLAWRPNRGSREGIEKVREQARLQLEQRDTGTPTFELLPREEKLGLARLPEPAPSDLFFDIESARFVGDHGLQYLWGTAALENGKLRYDARWASDQTSEREVFEAFIRLVTERREADPTLHVYHFGHYEPTTLKQLAQRYPPSPQASADAARCDDLLDDLLRAEVFVDLHAVVRQALRAGVEQYSLKDMEPFFGFSRKLDLRDASIARHALDRFLEMGGPLDEADTGVRAQVLEYNADDCLATEGLRDWLEELRGNLLSSGEDVARPTPDSKGPTEEAEERHEVTARLMEILLSEVPDEPSERLPEQHARWLLAHVLEYHRREDKATWWEFFRLRDLNDEEYLEEKTALSGLQFVEDLPKPGRTRAPLHRYRFPSQDSKIREDHHLQCQNGEEFGDVVRIDYATRTVDIKKRIAREYDHPTSVFEFSIVRAGAIDESLHRLAEFVTEQGLDGEGPLRPARDLLLGNPPRFVDGFRNPIRLAGENGACLGSLPRRSQGRRREAEGEAGLKAALRLVKDLDGGVLPIQGPPGSGKTYIGARMACALVKAGKKVGVVANSHKVIDNFLESLEEAAGKMHADVRVVHKDDETSEKGAFITFEKKNEKVLAGLEDGTYNVAGGTAWMWAREEFQDAVDVLFVDEAGQMALANVLASAQAGRNLVLLGDPQQLEQPQKGSHPDGIGISALEHLLEDDETMPDHKGLFLERTWRLSEPLCEYTSELFYQGRLTPVPGLANQAIVSDRTSRGVGLYHVPVEHTGNQSASPDEAEAIRDLVESLTAPGSTWTDMKGVTCPITLNDILIVAPYNAQVSDIAALLPDGARVGTVDKFQGQEAPVVIYSMTTSTREDAPRGMEFLYSLNRLNVASSRARCAVFLVATPAVLQPDCKSPKQMRLANAFCAYVERTKSP